MKFAQNEESEPSWADYAKRLRHFVDEFVGTHVPISEFDTGFLLPLARKIEAQPGRPATNSRLTTDFASELAAVRLPGAATLADLLAYHRGNARLTMMRDALQKAGLPIGTDVTELVEATRAKAYEEGLRAGDYWEGMSEGIKVGGKETFDKLARLLAKLADHPDFVVDREAERILIFGYHAGPPAEGGLGRDEDLLAILPVGMGLE